MFPNQRNFKIWGFIWQEKLNIKKLDLLLFEETFGKIINFIALFVSYPDVGAR